MSIIGGNILLSDMIDMQAAFASSSSVIKLPLFYRYGELVGLYQTDYESDEVIQYKIGDDGEWTDYSVPFAIPAYQKTKVYARIGENGTATYLKLTTTDEALGVYTESCTDFSFSYNNIDFGYTRIYNSYTKDWFESIHSKVLLTNSRLQVTLPDSSQYELIRKSADTYADEITGNTLTVTDTDYIFDDGTYKYYFAINTLNSVSYLSAIEDYSGNRLDLTRTINTDEVSISDATGRSFYISDFYAISADDDSNAKYYSVKEITDPNGNVIKYTTKNSRYISVVDQAGVILGQYEYASNTTNYTLTGSLDKTIDYYDSGRLKSITYDDGSYITYTYDDDNMTYTTLTSAGETTKTVYNDAFNVVSYTDEYGETTTYTYNDYYRVLTETTGNETTTYTYDESGNILSWVTGDTESDTYYSYDSAGRLVREQCGSSYTYYTYDNNGNNLIYATLKKDYTGEAPARYDSSLTCFDVTEYTYDSNGRVIRQADSDGNATEYEYDECGNAVKVTTTVVENGETVTTTVIYTYDSLGNVLTSQTGDENATYIYDAAGRTLLADENGEVTRTLYDEYGRTVQEIAPEDYDSSLDGLPDENTYRDSAAGHTYVYNDCNQLISETNRLGVTTEYEYYSTGEKQAETFDIYRFEYNLKGFVSKVYVDGVNTLTYNYDDDYNLTSEVYANGDVIRYAYDDGGNVTAQYHNDDTEPYVTFAYDEDGVLTEKVNTDTGLRYEYGENDEVYVYSLADDSLVQSYSTAQTEVDENEGTQAYTTVTESHFGTDYQTVIDNTSVTYTTGGDSIVYSAETDEDTYQTVSDSVTNNGDVVLSAEYTYDDDGNIISKLQSYYIDGESESVDIVNEYDADGKITATGYTDANICYSYDENSQLEAVENNYVSYTSLYTYDERGNILSKTIDGKTTEFTYSDSGWVDLLTSVNGVELTYDENGNVLTYGDTEYTWNSGRNLESITDGDNTYLYTYDESGIRASKTVNGTTTYYNTNDGYVLSQTDGENTFYFQYDSSYAPIGFILNGVQYFYITNQMGDVICITDSNGDIFAEYVYDEWGALLDTYTIDNISAENLAAAQLNPLRYRGYYYDTETGYYYLQSRYYDPEICRFINADNVDVAIDFKNIKNGINIILYCLNNPINSFDINGHLTVNLANKTISNAIVKFAKKLSSSWSVSSSITSKQKWNISKLGVTLYIGISASVSLSSMKGNVSSDSKKVKISNKCSLNFGTKKITYTNSVTYNNYTVKGSVTLGTTALAFGICMIAKYYYTSNASCYFSLDVGVEIKHTTTAAATAVVAAVCVAAPYVAPAVTKVYCSVLSCVASSKAFIASLSTIAGAGITIATKFA